MKIPDYFETSTNHLKFQGVTAKTTAGKGELLNAYFSSVFTPCGPNGREDSTSLSLKIELTLSEITVSVEEVTNVCVVWIRRKQMHGPDGIPPRILKECSQQPTAIWSTS